MPSPLTAADLVDIWAAFTENFPSEVTVQRHVLSGKLPSGQWVNQSTNVPCWFISAGSSLPTLIASMLTTGTLKQANAERCVFTGDKDVRNGDRLLKAGVPYSVRRVVKDDLQIAIIADVEKTTVEQT